MQHTTVSFSDIVRAGTMSASFWVSMQREFDSIKRMGGAELLAYTLGIIDKRYGVLGDTLEHIKKDETLERAVSASIMNRVLIAVELYRHIFSDAYPTIDSLSHLLKSKVKSWPGESDSKTYESRYLEEILRCRSAIAADPIKGRVESQAYVGNALKGSPESGELYQIATLLSFASDSKMAEVLDNYRDKLMEALSQYNAAALSAGGETLSLSTPLYGGEDSKENLPDKVKP